MPVTIYDALLLLFVLGAFFGLKRFMDWLWPIKDEGEGEH